jgi:hypothetical protein
VRVIVVGEGLLGGAPRPLIRPALLNREMLDAHRSRGVQLEGYSPLTCAGPGTD